jgi:hypothetical protein
MNNSNLKVFDLSAFGYLKNKKNDNNLKQQE